MSDRVLVPLPDGRWLSLSREAFAAALAEGAAAVAPPRTSTAPEAEALLTAEQMEARTSVPASWWEAAARRNEVPHRSIGKYRRFVLSEVERHFRSRPTDCGSAVLFPKRVGSRS